MCLSTSSQISYFCFCLSMNNRMKSEMDYLDKDGIFQLLRKNLSGDNRCRSVNNPNNSDAN